MNYNLVLEREKFTKLINLMKLFENHCTDCDIQFGKIRQKTNDRQLIIDIDVSSILAENDFSLSSAKNKLSQLKAFELDDNVQMTNKSIVIESNDSNYEISDLLSRLILRKPSSAHIDNSFITDEDFGQLVVCKEESLLFKFVISNYLKKRTSSIAMLFDNDMVKCELDELIAKIYVVSGDKQNKFTLQQEIQTNKKMPHSSFTLLTIPFNLDVASDITISCYTINDSTVLCKYEQTYFGVPIILYQRSKLIAS